MVKKNIVKKNNNIVKIGMIIPKLLNQEVLNQISNYKTIQYQFKFDEPVSIEVVKKFVSAFSIRTKETFDKINKSAKIFLAYYYTEIGRWIDCYGCNIGDCPEIFDPALEYGEDFNGKPLKKIEYIDIYIMEIPNKLGGGHPRRRLRPRAQRSPAHFTLRGGGRGRRGRAEAVHRAAFSRLPARVHAPRAPRAAARDW